MKTEASNTPHESAQDRLQYRTYLKDQETVDYPMGEAQETQLVERPNSNSSFSKSVQRAAGISAF